MLTQVGRAYRTSFRKRAQRMGMIFTDRFKRVGKGDMTHQTGQAIFNIFTLQDCCENYYSSTICSIFTYFFLLQKKEPNKSGCKKYNVKIILFFLFRCKLCKLQTLNASKALSCIVFDQLEKKEATLKWLDPSVSLKIDLYTKVKRVLFIIFDQILDSCWLF